MREEWRVSATGARILEKLTSPSANALQPAADREGEHWRSSLRRALQGIVAEFVSTRCVPQLQGAGVDIAADVLREFIDGGKCVRPTFMYVGWLCGADHDRAALRAAAGLELLHAFALLQDDVMDGSAMRRGRVAGHVAFAQWHQRRPLSGSPDRFGDSAAVLLGDLCLVWAAQMMRESGVSTAALERVWPRYDAMRTELAIGQFADLINDASGFPTLDRVLSVSRRKSGNYTVRRPLEMGAAMAGCHESVLAMLGDYGDAIGEAFQMRDDLLGIFGSPSVTGKPSSSDLLERKATTVVAAAYHLADRTRRRQLREFMSADDLDVDDIGRWRELIAATGAIDWIEKLIDSRLTHALTLVDAADVRPDVRFALTDMAAACTERTA
jgi:geranylgeranyl diphosphate synthase type I